MFSRTFRKLRPPVSDFKQFDYFVLAILSHGERNGEVDYIIGTDGDTVRLKTLTDIFIDGKSVKDLANKLKLILVQACRGKDGMERLSREEDGRRRADSS